MRIAYPTAVVMRLIEAPSSALNIVELQGTVQPLPEVGILDGHHLPEEFPPPIVSPPFRQAIADPRPYVIAAFNECYTRWLIERFQRPNDRQQVETLDRDFGLGIARLKALRTVFAAKNELPLAAATVAVDVGKQQEMGRLWGG